MIMDWYLIFNLTEFLALDICEKTYSDRTLTDRGTYDVTVTRALTVSMTVEGTMLPCNFLSKNPFLWEGKGVYVKDNNVFLGFETEDE